MTNIQNRLKNKHIFVTGATGFLAKVFIEKLLRSVPSLGGIHLLVRPRRDGTTALSRLEKEVKNSSVFDTLRGYSTADFDSLWADKVNVVSGDLSKQKFGMADNEYNKLKNTIDIVVNSAATVTFDDRLDTAFITNTNGPQQLLQLAKDSGNSPFMQVSTCYVCGQRNGEIAEDMSPPASQSDLSDQECIDTGYDALKMKKRTEKICENLAEAKEFIDRGMELARSYKFNDTYTFTKWMGEQLVDRYREDVPVVILRPAIIESGFNEPQRGWIDGLRMGDPLITAYGRGTLKAFPGNSEVTVDLIPVDFVANAMICALPQCGAKGDKPLKPSIKIYNVGSSGSNPLKLETFINSLYKAFNENPMDDGAGNFIRPKPFKMESLNEFLTRLKKLRMKAEAAFALTGKPLMRLLVDQAKQFSYFAKIYAPYTNIDCRFVNDRILKCYSELTNEDQAIFPCDPSVIEWEDYLVNRHIPGIRRYVLGDGLPPGTSAPVAQSVREGMNNAKTIWQAIENTCKEFGSKPALQMRHHGRWTTYSFQELLSICRMMATKYAKYELKKGDKVALISKNCPQWPIAYLSAIKCGLIVVALDPQLPAADIISCAKITDTKLLICGDDQLRKLETIEADNPFPTVFLNGGFIPSPGIYDNESEVLTTPVIDENDIASLLFTSGTTVAPKTVPLTHKNFLSNVKALTERENLGINERALSLLPLYHTFEFTVGLLTPLIAGATITYVDELSGPVIFKGLRKVRPTIVPVVPRLLKLFLDGINAEVEKGGKLKKTLFSAIGYIARLGGQNFKKDLHKRVHDSFGGELKHFVCGGASLNRDIYDKFIEMGFSISLGYGLTETSPVISSPAPGDEKPGSSGTLLPSVAISFKKKDENGIGEIWVKGDSIMSGYYNNDDANSKVFENGWFNTGDLGYTDSDGHLFITGREKDIIISPSGKNVYPEEVEFRYKNLPYMKEFTVCGVNNKQDTGENVEAVIVVEQVKDRNFAEIKKAILEKAQEIGREIPTHQQIHKFNFTLTDLPKTSTMKVKRSRLEEFIEGQDEIVNFGVCDGGDGKKTGTGKTSGDDNEKEGVNGHGRCGNGINSSGSKPLTDKEKFVIKLLSRLSERPESVITGSCHLLLDLGLDSLGSLNAVAEIETEFNVTCEREKVMTLSWVSDLMALAEQDCVKDGV